MEIELDEELIAIFRHIAAADKSEAEWAEIESDDMFHSAHYVGGFDATEMAFCFEAKRSDGTWWFQVPLQLIFKALNGDATRLKARPAWT